MISKKDFYKRWSELHGNAEIAGIVHAWLAISYRLALIATLLRISPNVLTLLGSTHPGGGLPLVGISAEIVANAIGRAR